MTDPNQHSSRDIATIWAALDDVGEGRPDPRTANDGKKALLRIEEQLQTVEHDRDLALESAKSNHAEKQRLKEQLEASQAALREIIRVEATSGYASLAEAPTQFARIARAALVTNNRATDSS